MFSKFKKVSVLAVVSAIVASNLYASGIPVVDAASIGQRQQQFLQQWTQTLKDYAEKVKVWGEEAMHRKQEVEKWANEKIQWANDLYTKTGVRDIVNFTKDMHQLYNEVYDTGFTIYSEVKNFNFDNFDERAWDLFIRYGGKDTCSAIKDISSKDICKKTTTHAFKELIVIDNQFNRLKREADELDRISKEIAKNHGKNEDIKNSLDTANQIALLKARQENNWRAYLREKDQLENEKRRLEEYRNSITTKNDISWR